MMYFLLQTFFAFLYILCAQMLTVYHLYFVSHLLYHLQILGYILEPPTLKTNTTQKESNIFPEHRGRRKFVPISLGEHKRSLANFAKIDQRARNTHNSIWKASLPLSTTSKTWESEFLKPCPACNSLNLLRYSRTLEFLQRNKR